MPGGTRVQQLVNDIREGKSSITRKFDAVYDHCNNAPVTPNQPTEGELLVTELRDWLDGTVSTLPNLAAYGLTAPAGAPLGPLSTIEEDHIGNWRRGDIESVVNAMERALTVPGWGGIKFFWDIDLGPGNPSSRTEIKPSNAGAGFPGPPSGPEIEVTFFTPRRMVSPIYTNPAGEDHVDISV